MAKLNYGINLRRIRSEAVGNFLYRSPDFEEKLNDYHAADNSAIKATLGELLKNNCALVKAFHVRRKKKHYQQIFILILPPRKIKEIDLSEKILARYGNSPYSKPYLELKVPWNYAETWRAGSDGKGPLQSWHRSRA